MKKLLLALLTLPLLAGFASCSDDDKDLPQVDFEVTVSGGEQNPDDSKIYVKQGTVFEIESIKPIATNNKNTALGRTVYYLNGIPMFWTITAPFGAKINTADMALGEYSLQIETTVYQESKTMAFAVLSYTLVVEAADAGGTETPGTSVLRNTIPRIVEN